MAAGCRTLESVLVFLVIFLMSSKLSEASHCTYWMTQKRHVKITNDIAPDITMDLHCFSKDDDLGVQTLAYQDNYSFKFRDNIWKFTVFQCNLNWTGQSSAYNFQAYNAERDENRCAKRCWWKISAIQGDSLLDCKDTYETLYHWDNSTRIGPPAAVAAAANPNPNPNPKAAAISRKLSIEI